LVQRHLSIDVCERRLVINLAVIEVIIAALNQYEGDEKLIDEGKQ
jgi:hypothetical protein